MSTPMSLPAWECGLKPNIDAKPFTVLMSLPAWECGLKRNDTIKVNRTDSSHSPRGSVD